MPGTKIYIDEGVPADLVMKVAADAGYTIMLHNIVKSQIRDFTAVYIANPGSSYPYPTKTWARIVLHDAGEIAFELQDVGDAAHLAWTAGDQAACNTFMADIAASL